MKGYLISVLTILMLALGLAGCAQNSSIPMKTESPPLPSITPTFSLPPRVFVLSDLLDDSHYWNSSWDANTLYQALISINRLYHKNHAYIKGVFDCDDMAIDIWDILYEQGITSVIGVGNLELGQEKITQVDHAWLIVMHKNAGYRFFILEPTNGETYAYDPTTMVFLQYLQGYFFMSSYDFDMARKGRGELVRP